MLACCSPILPGHTFTRRVGPWIRITLLFFFLSPPSPCAQRQLFVSRWLRCFGRLCEHGPLSFDLLSPRRCPQPRALTGSRIFGDSTTRSRRHSESEETCGLRSMSYSGLPPPSRRGSITSGCDSGGSVGQDRRAIRARTGRGPGGNRTRFDLDSAHTVLR
ncbi:hypothetical protein FB45DRAFT_940277 [Roridomyces roridus]|uniref:Uncharacterized protein n=1 Tax=Roridomyces roridus TaxID=1738132 RepID=A0AAD7FAL6_9AGAR|nr:hypothetical protein FB45DRAFT_940277 [Roridomyces roridus]